MTYEEVTEEFDEYNIPRRVVKTIPVTDEEGKAVPSPTRPPDEEQKKVFDNFMNDVNTFHQTLTDTLKEAFEDLLIADDLFILMNKEYTVDKYTGKIKSQRIYEIARLHPSLVEFDIDRRDGLPEKSHWICPLHRDVSTTTAPGNCPIAIGGGDACGAVMLPAMYRYYIRGHYRYFTRDEIIHKSYFSPSRTYGISPVYTVFEKTLTLRGIDRWYYRYFYERRIPPGLIVTYTDDPDTLRSEIARIKLELLENPETFPWLAASARTQRGRTDHIKLGYTFEEMDSISIRNEIRERIGNLWGVTPMHQGDPRQMGGLSRESAQTGLFEGVIESYQKAMDNGVLDRIVDEIGITDWKRVLAPPNEKSEQEVIELNKLELDFATGVMNIGYKAEFIIDDSGRAKFEYEKMPESAMGGFGAPGGMGFGDAMGGGMPGMGGEQELPPPPPPPNQGGEPVQEQTPPAEGGSANQQPFPPP